MLLLLNDNSKNPKMSIVAYKLAGFGYLDTALAAIAITFDLFYQNIVNSSYCQYLLNLCLQIKPLTAIHKKLVQTGQNNVLLFFSSL